MTAIPQLELFLDYFMARERVDYPNAHPEIYEEIGHLVVQLERLKPPTQEAHP